MSRVTKRGKNILILNFLPKQKANRFLAHNKKNLYTDMANELINGD